MEKNLKCYFLNKCLKDSQNLINEIRKIFYSFCQSKEITKKILNSIIKSMQI